MTAEQAVVRMKTEGRNTTYEANAGSQVREGIARVWSIIVAGQMEREKYRDLKDIETKNLLDLLIIWTLGDKMEDSERGEGLGTSLRSLA